MRSFKVWAATLLLLFVFTTLNAQTMSVDFQFGTSKFQWYNDSWAAEYPYFGLGYGDTYNPKMFTGSVSFGLWRGLRIKGSFGYGWMNSNGNMSQPSGTIAYTDQYGVNQSVTVLNYEQEIKTSVRGWAVEFALLYAIALDNGGRYLVYPGIGLGYYRFGYSGEWNVANEEYDVTGNKHYTAEGKFSKAALGGLGQYFILGFEIKVIGRLSIFMDFSKLGYSFVRETIDMDFTAYEDNGGDGNFHESIRETYGEEQNDYHTKSGLTDVSIQFGFRIGFK